MDSPVPWPNDLPLLPIWNDTDLCDRCFHWWNQSGISQEQDHCRPMYDTNALYQRFGPNELQKLRAISSSVRCPYFEPITRDNVAHVRELWGGLAEQYKEEAIEPIVEAFLAVEAYSDIDSTRKQQLYIPAFEGISLELIEHFARCPEDLYELHWRKYEELLNAIFKNQGFLTELGPGRGDAGIDIRLIHKDSIGEILTLVQAKRYKPETPIRLEVVQALAAVVDDQKANRGLLVTTSRYLPCAREFAERQRRKITLATSEDVVKWCKEISGRGSH